MNPGSLSELELRYVRNAVRFRLKVRQTPPSDISTGVIPAERREELDLIADWIVSH